MNNHYGQIIAGNLTIVNNERLRQLISKCPKNQEPKQICFEEAREETETGTDQFIERISNEKGIHKKHFSEWKSSVMSSVNEKIRILKNKITSRSVKSIFSKQEIKKTIFYLKEGFGIVSNNKVADNVVLIC